MLTIGVCVAALLINYEKFWNDTIEGLWASNQLTKLNQGSLELSELCSLEAWQWQRAENGPKNDRADYLGKTNLQATSLGFCRKLSDADRNHTNCIANDWRVCGSVINYEN